METSTPEKRFEQWWEEMPEGKIELLGGQLIISTLAGSRRILWELLNDYGPDLLLPMAPAALWWEALQRAFGPSPAPLTPAEWSAWAETLDYQPTVAPAGPRGTDGHHRLYDVLRWGMYHFGELSRLGYQLGRDFVIRLGEDGPTPDIILIDRQRMGHLYNCYLEGPPAIAVEITIPSSADQECQEKRRLYEQWGIPEYWLLEPEDMRTTFYRLQSDGRYDPLVIDSSALQRLLTTQEDIIYRSEAVPGLALSMLRLWTMQEHDWQDPWAPFLPVPPHPEPVPRHPGRQEGIAWDHIPFAPRLALEPVPIRFAEYISWCGRAKFERYGGGLKIDGSEGTRRVAGMLLMTFGLVEVVKLLHPHLWVSFLEPGQYAAAVAEHAERLLRLAQCRPLLVQQDDTATSYYGEIPGQHDLSGFGETVEECTQDLAQNVRAWVLLRLVRREPIPALHHVCADAQL